MSITAVTPYAGAVNQFPSHSLFDQAVEAGKATRVTFTDDDGEHVGWQFDQQTADQLKIDNPDRVADAGLRTPSAARQAAMDAANAATTTANTQDANARNVIRQQVQRVKGILPASRSDQDKWLLALCKLLLRED